MTIGSSGATFNVASGKSLTLAGLLSGTTGGLISSGPGTLIFSGSQTYSGATTVNAGTLAIGAVSSYPVSSPLIINNSATFDMAGFNLTMPSLSGSSASATVTNSSTTAVTLRLDVPSAGDSSYSGLITGNLSLVVSDDNATQTLNHANTYTGSTAITGTGGVVNGTNNALPVGTGLFVGATAVYNLAGFNQTVGSLSGSGQIELGSGTLMVNGGSVTTFSGVISDSNSGGSLVMAGAGELDLTASNTFTGPLKVTQGTLQISADQTPSTIYVGSPATIASPGGPLLNQIGGTVTTTGTVNIATTSGDLGTYLLSGGTLSVGTDFKSPWDLTIPRMRLSTLNTAGFLSVAGTEYINGMFTQDIGTTNTAGQFAVGYFAGTTGNYDMENGILNGGVVENIGYLGTATFTQNGGIHSTSEMFITAAAGHTSTYTMTDGNLNIFVPGNPNDLYIGGMAAGTASFSQSGGNVTIDGALDLSHVSGLFGSYDLSGGTLTAAAEYIGDGGNGTFTQEIGSTNTAQFMEIGFGAGSTGTYTITGGALNLTGVSFSGPLIVGDSGSGTLNISGNTFVNTNGNADIGLNSGSTGTVNQTGGTVSIGSSTAPADLFIARNPGSTGSYSLSGDDSLTVWSGMFLGYQGTGTFTQNGGQVAVKEVNGNGNTGFLSIGNNNPTSVGTYTISSGNLSADTGIYIGGTPGNGGGAGSSLNILGGSVNSGVEVFAGNSITINGGTLNAGFSLSGTGSLITGDINATDEEFISGSGAVFTQSGGSNTITGGLVSDGVLILANGGTYNLNGGTLSSPNVDVGGNGAPSGVGVLNIGTGGAMTVTSKLSIETTGTINLNTGGSFSTVNLVNNGVINLNGGTYNVSGVTSGPGSVAQTAGTVAAADGTQINNNSFSVQGQNTSFTSPGSVNFGVTANAVTAVTISQQAAAVISGNVGIANSGNLGTGSSTSNVAINVSNQASLTAHAITGGNVFGGLGSLNVTAGGTVTAAGINTSNLTIADSTFKIVTQPPQTNDDPDEIGAIAIGYSQNGTATVSGTSIVNAPVIKLGPTTGDVGTWTQTGGTVTAGIFSAGNDANVGSVSGIGTAAISGGALNATSLLVGGDDAEFQVRKAGAKPLGLPTGGGGGGPTISTVTISGNASVTATSTQITTNGEIDFNSGTFSPGDLVIDGGGVLNIGVSDNGSPDGGGIGPLATTPPKVVVFNSLTITGSSSVDLANNDADIHTTALSQVTAYLQSGFKNGAWNGSGIVSSVAKSTPAVTALGVEENAVQNTLTGAYTSQPILTQWENITVALNDVLVKYTLVGDADLSGSVNGTDYLLTDEGFDSHGVLTGWRNGDFDYDGKVNGDDYSLIDNVYNIEQSTKFNVVTAGAAEMIATNTLQTESAVPEPGAMILLGAMSCGLLKRRRR